MKFNAFDIANAFISLARKEGRSLTNMQLQKLVYIAFGYFAGFRKDRLFVDDIQAWNYGPVIPNLYHALKKYGVGAVVDDLPSKMPVSEETEAASVVRGVWNAYKRFSPIELSDLTHREGTPWQIIRDRTNNQRHASIPFEIIEEHYNQLIQERRRAKIG